jgi:HEPN domain-containing protein
MIKKEHIDYWLSTSKEDLDSAFSISTTGKFVWALFIAQLSLEKLMKAFWVRDNLSDFPPRTHDINRIANETNLVLTDEEKEFLAEVSSFNIEVRYPDYKNLFAQKCNKEFANKYLSEIKEFIECTLKKM